VGGSVGLSAALFAFEAPKTNTAKSGSRRDKQPVDL